MKNEIKEYSNNDIKRFEELEKQFSELNIELDNQLFEKNIDPSKGFQTIEQLNEYIDLSKFINKPKFNSLEESLEFAKYILYKLKK